MNPKTTEHMLRQRLVRIESKLTRLCLRMGLTEDEINAPTRTSDNARPHNESTHHCAQGTRNVRP